MKVAIPGATGLIGGRLVARLLELRHEPVILTRNPSKVPDRLKTLDVRRWDSHDPEGCRSAFENVDAVVNLAAEPIDSGRWTETRKKRIRESRVLGTKRIVEALSSVKNGPDLLVVGSAVGYYGSRGDEILRETEPAGEDFLAEVCRDLEAEAEKATADGIRVAYVRTGVVMSGAGGALRRMLLPFKMGLGGRIGSGEQWFPWIHESDVAGILTKILEDNSISGAINATAPGTVRNREFTKFLGKALGRPTLFPVPLFTLKIIFGEMSSVLVASHRAVPDLVIEHGYEFRFVELEEALKEVLHDD